MADLTFSQPERRSFLLPAVLVLAIVGFVFFLIYRFTPHRIADLTITHTAILPTHTVYKSGSILVGHPDQAQDDLYVLTTVQVRDDLKLPIFINDITASLIAADDSQLSASAVEQADLPGLYTTFPKLTPLAGPPLARETAIQPGQQAEGMVLLHFPVPQSTWDQRKSAILTIDLYHQGPITVTIPK